MERYLQSSHQSSTVYLHVCLLAVYKKDACCDYRSDLSWPKSWFVVKTCKNSETDTLLAC
jgi:hypothetical protein